MADLNFHQNAHDGIVFTDAENRVVYANPYFLQMMNIADPAQILNKPLPEYMWTDPGDPPKLFSDVRQNGFVRERELRLHNKDGQPVFAMCSSVASRDEKGVFIGTEIMLCNITSKRRIQVELEERTKALERVTEFSRVTLDSLMEAVQRGSSGSELLSMLRHLQSELNRVV